MSDCEDEAYSDDDCESYEYPSEDDDEDEGAEAVQWERNVRVKENHVSPWMDADDQDFRLWGDGSSIRMSIFSSLRQIVNSPSKKRILCSRDELFSDADIKVARIFLDVMDGMTVVYTLSFNATKTISSCPPVLRCVSYCGRGTYLFPNLLLPNCLGQFIDFGKVFDTLAAELEQYKPQFSSFTMVNEGSPYYLIQELAYLTQYKTSFVFDLTDSGIITGLERDRKVNPGDGVGYSKGSHSESTSVRKDDSHQYNLTSLMVRISKTFHERLLDSPLAEILMQMIAELSVEEVTRSAQYAEAIFKLVASLQNIFQQQSIDGFEMSTLCKLADFKDILSDEYGLQDICLPEDVLASRRASSRKRSPKAMEDVKASDSGANDMDIENSTDPVIFVDELFQRHSYLSEPTITGKAVLKRMKIEFNTLSTSLPPSIKYMVSEENFSLGKFMIEGPADTPYDGGYFLFDLKLPNDYPNSSPSVNFLTTGGGSVRFNPNLYNCGKVCLSLLGTWAGEKWDPQVSNINQVLQSICYLIFVEEPYFSELLEIL
mmetsp:Transcript_8461/g.14355  ORF Transcript_8461/g.14355 Transcript_8461/m.14355 type:complete len:544 (+) Transcript_8461:100-1731(+)